MYDWNALWHTHAGKQQRFASETLDINQLAPELGASLHRAARNPHDIAVYDHGDHYSLFMTGTAAAPVLRGQASATDTQAVVPQVHPPVAPLPVRPETAGGPAPHQFGGFLDRLSNRLSTRHEVGAGRSR